MHPYRPSLLALPLCLVSSFAAAQPPDAEPTEGAPAPTDVAPDAPAPTDAPIEGDATPGAPAPSVDAGAAEPPTDATTETWDPAAAETDPLEATEEAPDADDAPTVHLAIKVGMLAPQIVNDLGMNALVGLEVGYFLPFAGRRISLQFEASYAPPGADGNQSDPRIGMSGGTVKWDQTTHQTSFALGPTVRFLPPTERVSPYVSVLGRVYLLKTHMEGSGAGQTFGVNDEVSTRVGVTGALGVDLELGPGRLLLEVGSGWSQLPHATTGDTATTSLNVLVGYRFVL